MGLFTSFDIAGSGMSAQRLRSDIISQNIANVTSTRSQNGGPYRRKTVVFAEKNGNAFGKILLQARGITGSGVKVTKIVEDHDAQMNMVYDPSHPILHQSLFVPFIITEMTNMIDSSRAYEANATAFEAAKAMATRGLQIGQ